MRELRREGLSTRAIGSALGVHHDTVAEDLKRLREPVGNPTPDYRSLAVERGIAYVQAQRATGGAEQVTGLDGKSYPAARPAFEPSP